MTHPTNQMQYKIIKTEIINGVEIKTVSIDGVKVYRFTKKMPNGVEVTWTKTTKN